jgi:uncharacterized protein YjiS (DUF1127 family)
MAAAAFSQALSDWMARAGQRREYVRSNDRTTRDIGLDRAAVERRPYEVRI